MAERRWRSWQAWLAVAVVGLLAAVGAAYYLAPRSSEAPAFSLTSTGYENGTLGAPVTFSLADYRGKVVVLDMMAVSCTTCRAVTQDDLKPLHAAYGNRTDFALLSIDTWADPATGSSAGETRDELVHLQQRELVPWRHALDTDGVYRKYAAIQLPHVVVVGRTGQVLQAQTGLVDGASLRATVASALAGTSSASSSIPHLGLTGLAVAAGLASFFAPCSIGLLPAYLGLLLRSDEKRTPTVLGGLFVTAGMVSAYAALAALLVAASRLGFADSIRAHLPELELAMGLLLFALGLTMLFKLDWSRLGARLGAGKVDGRRGFFLFGLGYSLASFACTGPIFMPVLLAGLGGGALGVPLAFGAYSLCLAALLMAAAFLVRGGHQAATAWFLKHANAVSRVTAAFVALGGAYLVWFYWHALG